MMRHHGRPQQDEGNETNATTYLYKRGKKLHWYVQLLQEVYSKLLSNCKTLITLTMKVSKIGMKQRMSGCF